MEKDPYRYFRPEAREALEAITGGVLEIEKGNGTPHTVAEILRFAHTLKGAAGVVKLPAIGERAHLLEEALAPYRDGGALVPREAIDRVLSLVDEMGALLASIGKETTARANIQDELPASSSFETIRVEVVDLDALAEEITGVCVQVDAFRHVLEQLETLHSRVAETLSAVEGVDRTAPGANGTSVPNHRVIQALRDLDRSTSEASQRLETTVHRVRRGLGETRQRADRLRLFAAKSLFAEMERVARDAARQQEKSIVFETTGGEERLDAYILTHLRMALLHLVRNAVCHGIEDPRARAVLGKPPAGKVAIRVQRRGDRVAFLCSDDGRGIDLNGVRKAAIDRGIFSDGEAENLGAEHLLGLIFKAGFSTTKDADMMCGRGVGLDIVAEVASKLRGQVTAQSEQSVGTQVEIVVPMYVASMELLVVEQASVRASIPLSAIHRVLRVFRSEILSAADGESVTYQERAVPFRDLASLVGVEGPPDIGRRACSIVIMESGARLAGLGVDRILGRRFEVLRPLPVAAGNLPLFSGASFGPEGIPNLVLDPQGVVDTVTVGGKRPLECTQPDRPPVLVVDDSLTTRMLEKSILEANGYEVDLAVSGEEALRMAKNRHYGVMLVDVEMPGMNGFEFLDCARSDAELRGVPAILVTTRASQEDRRRGMESGARAYMLKSEFDEGLLLQTIRGIIG